MLSFDFLILCPSFCFWGPIGRFLIETSSYPSQCISHLRITRVSHICTPITKVSPHSKGSELLAAITVERNTHDQQVYRGWVMNSTS